MANIFERTIKNVNFISLILLSYNNYDPRTLMSIPKKGTCWDFNSKSKNLNQ